MNVHLSVSGPRASGRRSLAVLALGAALLTTAVGRLHTATAASSDYGATLYLSSTSSSVDSGSWQLVTTAPSSANTTTQNRIATATTGYQEFQAGFKPSLSTQNLPTPAASASTTPSNKGWIVDGTGPVTFAAGAWTFYDTVTDTYSCSSSCPVATLAVGVWKVTTSGGTITSSTLLVDPNCTASPCSSGAAPGAASPGTNFVTASGSTSISLAASLSSFSLASNEHLYVQYWRWESASFPITAGAANRLATFTVNDGVARITRPAAYPDVPTLGSVATRTKTTPQLGAQFSDADAGDTGTLSFNLCSDSACNTVLQSGSSSSGVGNGSVGTWTPASLVDGTYYWDAEAQDAGGHQSAWSATSAFVVDTAPPQTPTLSSPTAGARVNSTTLSAAYVDSDATDTGGSVGFELCSDSSCSSVVASGSGTRAAPTWTPAGVADGTYYWRARDTDTAGNNSSWSATRSFTLDTTAPSTPSVGATSALVDAPPTLSGTFSDPDAGDSGTVSFQLCGDSGCSSVVQTGSVSTANGATGRWTPSGLADGTYWWRAQGADTATNRSAWSATQSFQLDTTPPTLAFGAIAARVNSTPTLSSTFSDPDSSDSGSVTVELCHTSACAAVLQSATSATISKGTTFDWTPTSLADGTYFWRAEAQDAAGNQLGWTSAGSFVVDTVAPATPTLSSPGASARVNGLALAAGFSDPDGGDTGTVAFQICTDSACSAVAASGTSATVAAGTTATWTGTGLADGAYWWRARSSDAAGNQSGWSATRSLTLDTVAPPAPTLAGPADSAYLATPPPLSATFADTDAGDIGSLSFEICSDGACGTVVSSGTSSTVANGASGTWTPVGLAGGTYYWRAAGVDAAGNTSAWTVTRSFTYDGTAPSVPTLAGPSGRVLRVPNLTASYVDPGAPATVTGSVLFQLCRKSTCSAPAQTTTISGLATGATAGWTPTGIGDGTYYWRASAVDAAGNQSAWSTVASFVLDSTPPAVPVPTARPYVHVPSSPSLAATLADPGDPSDRLRMLVELCTDPDCTSITTTGFSASVDAGGIASWTAPSLQDGVLYWRAVAEDLAGNQSTWSAAQPFVVDTTPPSVPSVGQTNGGGVVREPKLTATFTSPDATDRGTVEFEICADASCTSVVADGRSNEVAPGAQAGWTPAGLTDGSYFWRARALDEAGNESSWSSPVALTVDQTPPAKPRGVTATVRRRVLTVRWRPAAGGGTVAYVLVVDGRAVQTVSARTRVVRVKLRRGDRRTFAIAAVDRAGNVSAPTTAYPHSQPIVRAKRVRGTGR